MRLKTLLITIGVLAVLSMIVAVVRRPSPAASADARINQPLVEAATIEKASTLRLTEAGKIVELNRQSDGTWRVASYHDFPADFTKLSTLVGNLTTAKLQRLVTSNPERISRLEFKDTKIELLDNTGKELWAAMLGKTAETGGRFIRFSSEPKAYLASLNVWLDPEPKNWANTTLINVKPEDIAKVEITFPQGQALTITRAKKDDPWKAQPVASERSVDAGKVSALLSSLTNLRFTETLDLNDPKVAEANAHNREANLTTFDGKALSITFARKPEDKKLKPPAPASADRSGPAALGSLAATSSIDSKGPASDPKLVAPEYETIPAGPVFVRIESSDSNAPVNALMQKRAFQVSEFAFTNLPQSPSDLLESVPVEQP
jgi:hypothetical protein